jgi:ELWxxDGT repeat protein
MRILQILTASGLVTGLCAQVLVKDINPVAATTSLFSDPAGGVDVFGVIYFAADDGVHGRELWRTDGTAAGTSLVADINPGPASSNPTPPVWINGSSTFLFAADDGAHGRELWSSNGTAQATALLLDVRPGADSSSPAWLTPIVSPTFASFFFSADDGVHGRELWRSNLTAAGTTMVSDLRVGALGSMTVDSEIWDDPISTNPFGYFTADNGSIGEELWRIGAGAPVLVRDINPGTASSTPRSIMKSPLRGGILFAATDATNGREPGTWSAVPPVWGQSLAAGSASSNPTSAVPAPSSSSTTPSYLVNGTGGAR